MTTEFTQLRFLAGIIWRLNYAELMEMSRDLHSDSDVMGKTATQVADLLSRWAERNRAERVAKESNK